MATKYLYEIDNKLYNEVNGELAFVADSPITEDIIMQYGTSTYNSDILSSNDKIKLYIHETDPSVSDIYFNYTLLYKEQLIIQDYDFEVEFGAKSLNMTCTVNANDKLLILLSNDQGNTWKTVESGIVVDCNLEDISTLGMTHITLNTLTKSQLDDFVGESTTLRMAIYMWQSRSDKQIKIDHIRLVYNM